MTRYKYEVEGSVLSGAVSISGAKNAILPILACTLINKGVTYIENCPFLSDIEATINILKMFGCQVIRLDRTIIVDAGSCQYTAVPSSMTSKCRATLAFLGSCVARFKEADIAMPGGCVPGPRPIDMHIESMKAFGLDITQEESVHVTGTFHPGTIQLSYPSVGVTENILMMAATCAEETIIKNAAREPEIVNLCQYLEALGVNVKGQGSSKITIKGKEEIAQEAHITIIPDRIEAATFLIAAAITGRDVDICNCNPGHMTRLLTLLNNMGCEIKTGNDYINMHKGLLEKELISPLYIVAKPYPAFPTDMQPLIMPLLCLTATECTPSILTDTVFPCRYVLNSELKKMGARVHVIESLARNKVNIRSTVVEGMEFGYSGRFRPAKDLVSHDLRGGAALVIASLGAEVGSTSHIYDNGYIQRGYENISEKFSQIGGKVNVKLLK